MESYEWLKAKSLHRADVAIAAARFNDFIVSSLLKGATTAWAERGGAAVTLRRAGAGCV